jgi:hypothetical protein
MNSDLLCLNSTLSEADLGAFSFCVLRNSMITLEMISEEHVE